jgi:hypothetical protein
MLEKLAVYPKAVAFASDVAGLNEDFPSRAFGCPFLESEWSTLKYQKLDNLVEAIGPPKDRHYTYCRDGADNR